MRRWRKRLFTCLRSANESGGIYVLTRFGAPAAGG